jgi:hypothetical protein
MIKKKEKKEEKREKKKKKKEGKTYYYNYLGDMGSLEVVTGCESTTGVWSF